MKDRSKIDRSKFMKKQCVVCGKNILIKLFPNGNYTGGNYFGKIPLCTNRELNKVLEAGTTRERWGKTVIEVLKKDPKPYEYVEYWECPKCYWGK